MPGIADTVLALGVASATGNSAIPQDMHQCNRPRARYTLLIGDRRWSLNPASPAQFSSDLDDCPFREPVVLEVFHLVLVFIHFNELHLDFWAQGAGPASSKISMLA